MLEWGQYSPLRDIRANKKKAQSERRKQTRMVMQDLNKDMYFKTPYDENSTSNLPFGRTETSNRVKNDADFDAELDDILREINFPCDKDRPVRASGMDIHEGNSILSAYMLKVVKNSEIKAAKILLSNKKKENSLTSV